MVRLTPQRSHGTVSGLNTDLQHAMTQVCAMVRGCGQLALAGGVYLPASDLGQVEHKLTEPALLVQTWTKKLPPTPSLERVK